MSSIPKLWGAMIAAIEVLVTHNPRPTDLLPEIEVWYDDPFLTAIPAIFQIDE